MGAPQRRAGAHPDLLFSPAVQNLNCHKGVFTSIEEDPSSMFNWTTEKVESCEGGSFCQESLLMVKAGEMRKGGRRGESVRVSAAPTQSPKPQAHPPLSPPPRLLTGAQTAVLATKGCIYDGTQAVTYVQHSPPPGIITVSYTSYCEDSFCNGRKDLQELWRPAETLEAWTGERWGRGETI